MQLFFYGVCGLGFGVGFLWWYVYSWVQFSKVDLKIIIKIVLQGKVIEEGNSCDKLMDKSLLLKVCTELIKIVKVNIQIVLVK